MRPARPLTTFSKTIIAVALVAGIAVSSLQVAPFTQAQQEAPARRGVTAIPPKIGEDDTLVVKPGEKTQVTLRVQNNSTEAVTITSLAQDFIVMEDGATPIPVSENEEVSNRWSLASWMIIAPNEQLVLPGQTAGVNVLIEVPADALPGGHYAMVVHQPNNPGASLKALDGTTNESASSISQKVGTLVYLRVAGPINYEAFVRGFTAPNFTEYGPVPFSFTADNRSDVHIKPQATIEIYDAFNRKIDSIQVESKNVFPFTSRLFEAEWRKTWGWGYYRAKLTMSFGDQGQVVTAIIPFWFFPIKLVLAGLVGLLTLLAVGISIRRHLIHRSGDEQKRITLLEEKLRTLEQDKLRTYEDDKP